MTVLRTVRVAAIQATPVILDAEATVHKAVRLLGDAAAEGAELAVLPETFVSVYPSNAWARQAVTFDGAGELWERMWLGSVDVPGPLVDELIAACRSHGMHLVIGVNERESDRPGTLYNSMLWLGPKGLLHKHRKLMPTQHERLFHGIGRGDDLLAVDTPCGRIGGLICWENRMPLARYVVYRQGPQIWAAPTADDTDGWVAHMRAIAIESGAFVVSVPQYIPRAAFPGDFPVELPERDVFGNGGAVIVEPTWGKIVAGPLYGEEGMLVHDCDLRLGLHAKRVFDAVGHYSRDDVLISAVSQPAQELDAASQGGLVGGVEVLGDGAG
ncbi:MAG: nitrilase [Solirubrobacteraceae bacterium]|jgi:nitrilase|nr:nitrilase [Solirubrobacteraceae bacterium]